ncbi:MAG: Xyloglucanase [Cirrosporium novae-zelandiae]|nr:MAG: Xyloglucanase [Cirrosporium novae-zelandiae]
MRLSLRTQAIISLSFPLHSLAAYTWNNVKIGGGGGFISGIVFNPTTQGVAYARTDIGGLYKLNPDDDSWTPLTDAIADNTDWHNWGIDAVATDPVDSNNLYAAVGMYTNSWDPSYGSIIRSTDQGTTWSFTSLSFKVGGNMPGRGMGERLVVDPNNNKIIYFGARSGNGLWKSTDQGVTFKSVTSFTAVGTYEPDSTDTTGYNNDLIGLAWITFDSTSSLTNGATSRIFVGTASEAESIYVSEDAGATWSAVSGQPTGYLPHKGKLSPDEETLYITYSNGAGPYDGTDGSVYRYSIANKAWTDITPVSGSDLYYGFGGLAVDAQNNGTIMVASLNSWWPDAQIFRSNDSGSTWSRIWEWNGYPNINYYYSHDTDKAPWIDNSRLSSDTKVLGWMIESMEIDPFDSNHWLYGTGVTLYGGHDLEKWDTIHNVTISSLADGIEETAVQSLTCPSGGPLLLSAVGDVGGFRHTSLTTAPTKEFMTPEYTTNSDIDYAGNTPTEIVRVGSDSSDTNPQIALSYDGGESWSIDYGASTGYYGGKVALSANGDTVLWSSTSNGVLVSQNTASFSTVSSLPSTAAIASDKRNNTVFYGLSGGTFYVSTNTGKTFTSTATLGSSSTARTIRVNPTKAGDVWATTDTGLFHSTDYGKTFTHMSSSTLAEGWSFALGKGSGSYWNLYGVFNISGTVDLFESTDTGSSWSLITNDDLKFGAASANVVAASPDTAGLVSLARSRSPHLTNFDQLQKDEFYLRKIYPGTLDGTFQDVSTLFTENYRF